MRGWYAAGPPQLILVVALSGSYVYLYALEARLIGFAKWHR